MDLEKRVELATRAPTEETLTTKELRGLLETKQKPVHYQGFEISGLLHLGSLIVSGHKLRDFIDAGFETTVFLADWHSVINHKLGGDWERIRRAAKYYEEAFKFITDGKIKVRLGSDVYHDNDGYWKDVLAVMQRCTLSRTVRCLQIMGRKESEALDTAQFMYPAMQATDIRALGVDVAHAGLDQRKVHVLAREVFPKLGWTVPVAVHHHLLSGLAEPELGGFDEDKKVDRVISAKMSKSKPWTCVFVHDSRDQIVEKLKKAWCPEKTVEGNPVLEMVRYVVFREAESFAIERSQKYGGPVTYDDPSELENDYASGKIHPLDLKNSLVEPLDRIIKPVREHFEKPANRKLLGVYSETEITR